ncbi:MAG: hypothetical protein ACFFE8_05685 [Candidatus Heimdallarchaeota archaeon]
MRTSRINNVRLQIDSRLTIILATIIVLGDRILVLLTNTKNLHKLPLPSLDILQFLLAVASLTLLLLFLFRYEPFFGRNIELLIFSIIALNGVNTTLFLIQEGMLSPFIRLLTSIITILLILVLSTRPKLLESSEFANLKLIVFTANLGLLGFVMAELLETLYFGQFIFYFQFVGTLFALFAILIFSSTAIVTPYYRNQRKGYKTVLAFIIPLLVSFMVSILLSSRQLTVQILTSSLTQTLRLTIFREIPGISQSVQSFFLTLILGAIFLGITGLVSLYSKHKITRLVGLTGLLICGLEVVFPYIVLLRLIIVFELMNNSSPNSIT